MLGRGYSKEGRKVMLGGKVDEERDGIDSCRNAR